MLSGLKLIFQSLKSVLSCHKSFFNKVSSWNKFNSRQLILIASFKMKLCIFFVRARASEATIVQLSKPSKPIYCLYFCDCGFCKQCRFAYRNSSVVACALHWFLIIYLSVSNSSEEQKLKSERGNFHFSIGRLRVNVVNSIEK